MLPKLAIDNFALDVEGREIGLESATTRGEEGVDWGEGWRGDEIVKDEEEGVVEEEEAAVDEEGVGDEEGTEEGVEEETDEGAVEEAEGGEEEGEEVEEVEEVEEGFGPKISSLDFPLKKCYKMKSKRTRRNVLSVDCFDPKTKINRNIWNVFRRQNPFFDFCALAEEAEVEGGVAIAGV
jgi:hypothetical protein